jgi:hypothetical protein
MIDVIISTLALHTFQATENVIHYTVQNAHVPYLHQYQSIPFRILSSQENTSIAYIAPVHDDMATSPFRDNEL